VSRASTTKTTIEFAEDVLALVAEDNRRKKTALGIATAVRIEDAIASIRRLFDAANYHSPDES
jgi:hypothetical protein